MAADLEVVMGAAHAIEQLRLHVCLSNISIETMADDQLSLTVIKPNMFVL